VGAVMVMLLLLAAIALLPPSLKEILTSIFQ
jgi:hypothetical protein